MPIFPAVCLLLLSAAAVDGSSSPTVVTLADGKVRGLSTPSYREFRGIPFAAPPLGEAGRWRPPRPPAPWKPSTLDATAFRHNCLQSPSAAFMGWPQPLSTLSEDWPVSLTRAAGAAEAVSEGGPRKSAMIVRV